MKYFFFVVFFLLTINSFSQKKISAYIELRGNVDALGNITLENVIKPNKMTKADSLVDYSELTPIIALREPRRVINKLSEIGWTLVSVTQVSSDKENRPNSPFLLYYLKKDFELKTGQ